MLSDESRCRMKAGVDIVEIQRIHNLIDRYGRRFLDKAFTEAEQRYCESGANRDEKYAGRFAGKEALRKALQPFTDEKYLPFTQIEILPNTHGMPVPVIHAALRLKQSFSEISLSISHERRYAIAFAVIS